MRQALAYTGTDFASDAEVIPGGSGFAVARFKAGAPVTVDVIVDVRAVLVLVTVTVTVGTEVVV